MPVRRQRSAIQTPPRKFPVVIKSHFYDESGLNSCLHCGQRNEHRLHIRPHGYQRNFDSKLAKCMCGAAESHPIHTRGNMA